MDASLPPTSKRLSIAGNRATSPRIDSPLPSFIIKPKTKRDFPLRGRTLCRSAVGSVMRE